MPLFVIVSRSSRQVTLILTLTVLFSMLAYMVSMAAVQSSHIGVHSSWMLFVCNSISSCGSSMPPVCLPYLSRLTLCIGSQCHFWSTVTFRIAGFILLAIIRIAFFIAGCIMLLIAVISSSSLRLPFLVIC